MPTFLSAVQRQSQCLIQKVKIAKILILKLLTQEVMICIYSSIVGKINGPSPRPCRLGPVTKTLVSVTSYERSPVVLWLDRKNPLANGECFLHIPSRKCCIGFFMVTTSSAIPDPFGYRIGTPFRRLPFDSTRLRPTRFAGRRHYPSAEHSTSFTHRHQCTAQQTPTQNPTSSG